MFLISQCPEKGEFITESGCNSLYWEPLEFKNAQVISAAIQGFQRPGAAVYIHREKPDVIELLYGLCGIACITVAEKIHVLSGPLSRHRLYDTKLIYDPDTFRLYAEYKSRTALILPLVIDTGSLHLSRGTTSPCRYLSLKVKSDYN